mgnify:CR=1 FL=1
MSRQLQRNRRASEQYAPTEGRPARRATPILGFPRLLLSPTAFLKTLQIRHALPKVSERVQKM